LKRSHLPFLLLLWALQAFSQSKPNYQLLTTADGLAQGFVYDILQSRDGFIWIATKDGLNRYDGSRFKVFSPDPFDPYSIANSEVRSIFEDSRGWIWIAFQSELDVLNPASGHFYHVLHDGNKNFGAENSSGAPSMEETPDGSIWFWGPDGIWKIKAPDDLLANAAKKGTSTIEPACKMIPKPPVQEWEGLGTSKFLVKAGKLLIATRDGLFSLDPSTDLISTEVSTPGWTYGEITTYNKDGILASTFNNLSHQMKWVLITPNGTQSFTGPGWSNRITCSPDGFLWIQRGNRIQKWQVPSFFNQGRPELEIDMESIYGSFEGGVNKFFFDKSDVMWIGTGGYGIMKINAKVQNFKSYLPQHSQRQLLEAPDGGVFSLFRPNGKYPSKFFQTVTPHTDFYNPVLAMDFSYDWGDFSACFDAAGNGWSSNRNKKMLYRTDARTKSVKSFPWSAGYGLMVDRSGALLGASERGLTKFDPKTETSAEFPYNKPQKSATTFSYNLFEDVDGAVWIFGFEGLTKAVPEESGYHFEYFKINPADHNSLSSNIVLSVADDPLEAGRYLWVGTKSGGLNRLDKKTGQFRQYKTAQGLPDNVIYGVLAENTSKGSTRPGYIWLSTNKGLCRFDVRAETCKNFTAADGLQDNEFNSSSYLKTRDGTLIFGGVKGLTVFHPDSLRFNEHLPQTHIVDLQVNNQDFDIWGKSSITLSHRQNLLNFEFAALEFSNPAQNQYRYQLVGVDKDWVALYHKNSIQFANLTPGDYTLRVQGSNNDGVWSEQSAELRFTIRPPWWSSWWAWLIYLAILATGIWRYYQYLLQRRFSDQEKLRLKALDEFKSRFFTNITHEFRTPLTVMLGMSEQLAKEEKDEPKRYKIGLIKRSGENLLRLINQILDLAKLESNTLKMNYIQGDVLAYLRYIAESLHSLANAQNLMLRVESEQAKIVMDYDPERLLQIVHNLLSNAVKFTPSGGKVVLRANRDGDWLEITVTDTGAGIPPEELPHLFERFFQAKNQDHAKAGGTGIGLSLTRELVKVMHGEISVESTVGTGTSFFVKLPVTNNSVFEERTVEISKALPTNRLPAGLSPNNESDQYNILLIEDNPDVVEYLNACLQGVSDREGRSYGLDFAYNGQAGIEKALETVPDIIVSDVMMPFKDGFEVVEALKNDERTSHIPIILLTAKADVQSRLTGLRRGADAYLSKPFHQEELLVTLENLLETRRKLQLKYQQSILVADLSAPDATASDPEDAFLQNVRAIIEANYTDENFGLPQLCQKIRLSRSQLFRKMKALTDIAPSDLIRKHRLNKAKALLESGAANVAEAAWEVGFKDPSYFSKLYQEEFGEAPSEARK
jgi:signal transduction histidine kinase/CheY-like chemotaxis protein/AraC-like DNA-binding protein/streptogramin lyase